MALETISINLNGTIVEKIIGAVPTENNYTDAEKEKLSGVPKITIGTTPPATPAVNELWIDTN
jgi:hypothetical protein